MLCIILGAATIVSHLCFFNSIINDSKPSVSDVVEAFVETEAVEQLTDVLPQGVLSPFGGLTMESIELGERELDRIQIRRIQWQEHQARKPQNFARATEAESIDSRQILELKRFENSFNILAQRE